MSIGDREASNSIDSLKQRRSVGWAIITLLIDLSLSRLVVRSLVYLSRKIEPLGLQELHSQSPSISSSICPAIGEASGLKFLASTVSKGFAHTKLMPHFIEPVVVAQTVAL
ncbi:hypothetical protein EVAR_69333_1 [Eumeta japonica]|uniref:Uncharacterized protein n=1 Tax=Eumeta variegata TaxID=151549 RepID=A0A4C2AAM4_EUMVA|nr:hypothetical protein EVAR_69333_1 [Eumeta japonica]